MSTGAMQRAAWWLFRICSATAVAGFALGSMWLIGSARERDVTRGATLTPRIALVSDIPSHNRRYRATLVPSDEPIERDRPLGWTVEVRTAAGRPVDGATLTLESTMPDVDTVRATRPRAAEELGEGRYRIEGLRFSRSGWWNVSLRISAAGVTDSLAFNLVLR